MSATGSGEHVAEGGELVSGPTAVRPPPRETARSNCGRNQPRPSGSRRPPRRRASHLRSQRDARQLRAALERGVPPIVGWWSKDRGCCVRTRSQVAAACHKDRTAVTTRWSPEWARRGFGSWIPQWREGRKGRPVVVGSTWMSRSDFLRAWYDTDTPRYVRVKRWFMVAEYPSRTSA